MADLVLGNLIPKLYQLLKEEYNLQTGMKDRISSLTKKLEVAQAALRKEAEVPWDQLDEHDKLWACKVREASYDMEDVLDTFLLVHVQQGPQDSYEKEESLLKQLLKSIVNVFKTSEARRKISGDLENRMTHLEQVMEWYKVDVSLVRPATTRIDPRLLIMYKDNTSMKQLVGIDKSSGDLISLLQSPQRGHKSNREIKIVSIVGVGGLGKTTLAKHVYDKLTEDDFDCRAFVSVGCKPNLKGVLMDILYSLDKKRYQEFSELALVDERQLIEELRSFLENKRFFIVIDDIWELQSWQTIRLVIHDDNNCGGRIIITTRKLEVAMKADEIYKLQPLPYERSRELFYTKIRDPEERYVDNLSDEISYKIIMRCGGIPLAIITMAHLLHGKRREEWLELCRTNDSIEGNSTMRILSLSYYDMPSHLRTCLLYLSAFPEDHVIPKDSLIWMWVTEGLVQQNQGMRLFEIGECYFNDLINRSMIQAVQSNDDGSIIGCRVHGIVLDFIRKMSSEESVFTILDYDQGTPPPLHRNNVRRLAHHNMTNRTIPEADHSLDLPKVRSSIALGFGLEACVTLITRFKLLRVIAIENFRGMDDVDPLTIEHLGHLLHLRFLGLKGTRIYNIPKEIGALRFLLVLDLSGSYLLDLPSSCSLPKQLVCLRVTFDIDRYVGTPEVPLAHLTSLEELSISFKQNLFFQFPESMRRLVKELGKLNELRVLDARISWNTDEQTERDLVESLCHLHKLQHLRIEGYSPGYETSWKTMELVLPCHLQHLAVSGVKFCKLPSCIIPSRLPNLSHMRLSLECTDGKDLEILGAFPELRFLDLSICGNNNDDETLLHAAIAAGAFPKLKDCYFMGPLVLTFLPGTMPCLECFKFHVILRAFKDSSLNFSHFDSLRYITSLDRVYSMIDLRDAKTEEAEEAEAAMRTAVQSHPNRPMLTLSRVGIDARDKMRRDSIHHSRVAVEAMPLESLKTITKDFSKELGTGTFGTVYKGLQNDKEIAVKLLHQTQRHGCELEFKKEFENLMRLKHPNIVQLLGYCYDVKCELVEYKGRFVYADKIYRALCFEYMHHGSLKEHLHDEFHGLDWQTRYNIIKGICDGLKYLHEGLESPMFHLDLKPGNILLDKNMVPKLADFGLSKLVSNNQTQSTLSSLGTIKYCPPEYIERNYVSNKFDIFSFGVVMIDLIAGSEGYRNLYEMPRQEFINHVQENWRKRIQAAPDYTPLNDYQCHQVTRYIKIALDCVSPERNQRPSIGDLTRWLNETYTTRKRKFREGNNFS